MDMVNLVLASVSTTPKELTEELMVFCSKVVPGGEPKYVPVAPAEGSEAHNCFLNVEKVIAANGGEIAYGWTIWEGKVLLDAEFHACWVPPDNWLGGTFKMLDVTPKPDREKTILFLPDPNRRWDGHNPVENVTAGRYDHPAVEGLIAACHAKHELLMRYWVGPGIPIPVPPDSFREAEAKIAQAWIECGKMLAKVSQDRIKTPKEKSQDRKRKKR